MDNFLKIWAVKEGRIYEKVHLFIENPYKTAYVPSSSEQLVFIVRGTYFGHAPVKDINGNISQNPPIIREICRKFDYLDEANAHIKLTFQEFFDRYPKYFGRAIIDDLIIVNGKPEGFNLSD